MKQYIILTVALILVVVLNYLQTDFLKGSGNVILEKLEDIEKSLENEDYILSQKLISNLETSWNKVRDRWDILTEHDDVEEFESMLASIKSYSKINEQEEALNQIALLKQRVNHIIESESLSLATIF